MKTGIAGKVAQGFIDSKLTPLLMIVFLALGFYGTYLTPREEEPQIDVPMADIFVGYPGATPEEVEKNIAIPLEKVLSNIEGVEYVYSTSMPDQAMVSARFYVGEDVERSLVRLYNEIMKNMDRFPEGATQPMVKTRSIDDVPIMTLTLWSNKYSDFDLRRLADEMALEVKQIEDVAQTDIHGGRTRQVSVNLDKNKMASYGIDPMQVVGQIQAANQELSSGSFSSNDTEYLVDTGDFFKSAEEVRNVVVDVQNGDPIYLHSIAEIRDGPEEPSEYVSYGIGHQKAQEAGLNAGESYPAVTISVAKRSGADAMAIAEQIQRKVDNLDGSLIPSDVNVTTTRNYGETASAKVFSLLEHLLVAILAVTFVVALALGWRGGLVVFLSVPVTFALTLFLYYMFGYTLNRITLFALVFVTGIVVDDSIIIAENMHRHFKMKKLPLKQAAIASISEVGNPTILATFTVISAVLPMAFVSGLMGPYMSPMPIGASLAMIFSLIVALVITPWLAYILLPHGKTEKDENGEEKEYDLKETFIYRWYERTMNPLLENATKRWLFIGGVTVLLLASTLLFVFRMVEVKMLPFDNKNEIQLIIDMPEGTTLERTNAVAREVGLSLKDVPEIKDYQIYAGDNAPINFNGLVRHYDLRKGPNVADIQLNLIDKGKRSDQSHAIAKRIRPIVQKVGEKYNANVKVVEVPPGPPVQSTIVAEVYGPDTDERQRVGRKVKGIFEKTAGIVDVDWMKEAPQTKYKLDVNTEKAMMSGISSQQVVQTVTMALRGQDVSHLYSEKELNDVPITVKLPKAGRSHIEKLKQLHMKSASGAMIPVADLVTVTEDTLESSIHRKNQRRVTYVLAEVAGEIESPVYALLDTGGEVDAIDMPEGYDLAQIFAGQPFMTDDYTLKWDGEWQITYEVFRDLGIAFAVVLVIIYMLIIGWFQDFKVPIIMMIAIPLSLVGILVGHWVLGAFFTATSMIGMIALAGIMVRNSVLLIDFINIRLGDGESLKQAVIEAGAVRSMPILLTAGTVVIGAVVILFDPIFQGLAISLMGGAIASTALTLVMIPLIYFMVENKMKELNEKKA
ncbi:efflux RND transporter permease subunit [Aliifodinibius salicampi]|uniref:Efflux RND transporter permease subunit n=1 Tax=Fodinibius salicampi TaxID=1920655 RepID=A0ABT3Q270_9BACT|nr:efflux RND transporter permease subunit [Fodinibius salicampi]MCW9714209.1 efflux RND transporter permease subunit [Fodinibius salicampi]